MLCRIDGCDGEAVCEIGLNERQGSLMPVCASHREVAIETAITQVYDFGEVVIEDEADG